MKLALVISSLILLAATPALALPRELEGEKIHRALTGTLGAGNQEISNLLQKQARNSDLTQKEKALLQDFRADQKRLDLYRNAMKPVCRLTKGNKPFERNYEAPDCNDLSPEQKAAAVYQDSMQGLLRDGKSASQYLFTITFEQRLANAEAIEKLYKKWNAEDPDSLIISTETTSSGTVTTQSKSLSMLSFPSLGSRKLEQLAEKRARGEASPMELQTLEDAEKDEARMNALRSAPVCEVVAQRVEAEKKTQISLGKFRDCATLSPAELAETHEVPASMQTSFGNGGASVYRYPGTEQEEAARAAEVRAITNKWKQWEQQQ